MSSFEIVIGLEIHAQLMTQSKIFCTAPNSYGQSENSLVGPVSGGLPGALPVLNDEAVLLAIRAGLALNCQINSVSQFARKNYFYPDLPKGYQISQFDAPICGEGHVDILLGNQDPKKIRIERIHMEEDAGKSVHYASYSLINLNRSGVPLVEIVTKPDIRSATEAVSFLKKVHSSLVFAKVSDGNMEEGNFRCDVNLSVREKGAEEFGTRTEMKNLNSFRFIEKAIAYESARQIALVSSGGKVVQETRGWDAATGKSFSMRKKEEAHDYRYFPDPDLPPLKLTEELIDSVKEAMPELPEQMKNRLMDSYGLNHLDAEQLTSEKALAEYFEKVVAENATAKLASNWILSELMAEINKSDEHNIENCPLDASHLANLISLIESGKISGKIAKKIFPEVFASNRNPEEIVEEQGLLQVSDDSEISSWIDSVIEENPSVVEEFKSGKTKVMAFLVGQVMKMSRGKANPGIVTEKLKKALE